jgi:hypothetical protein
VNLFLLAASLLVVGTALCLTYLYQKEIYDCPAVILGLLFLLFLPFSALLLLLSPLVLPLYCIGKLLKMLFEMLFER